jgi:hypothetical protein
MNKVLNTLIGLLFLVSCGVSKDTDAVIENVQETVKSISFELVGKGNLGGAGEEGIFESNVIVQTRAEWDALISKMDATNIESKHFEIQDIDFGSSTVLACFDKVQGTGGHSIKIYEIIEGHQELSVHIKKSAPNEMATSVMTQPYYIVVIDKTTKKIVFN